MVRYNQVKRIKKAVDTDQSNHRFPESQQHIAIASLLYLSIQAMSSRENPKLKVLSIRKLGLLNPNSAFTGVFV